MNFPVDAHLGKLHDLLKSNPVVLLSAEPGAGKTTRIPPSLLKADWCPSGKRIIMLEPRRVAARSAARFIAAEMGERVGQTIGYRTRGDSKVSSKTRIEIVTEGVFTRLIVNDPELSDYACIIFDEFHERGLDNDLGFALARDAQIGLREDLRILVMSATLNEKRLLQNLGDVPLIQCEGRTYPVEKTYRPMPPTKNIASWMAEVIVWTLKVPDGNCLAFLPGRGDINRVSRLVAEQLPDDVQLHHLHGGLNPKDQDDVLRPSVKGSRKLILSTAIAESALTIDGVTCVIDSGLARVPIFEPLTGLTRLETRRASFAEVEQRAGRAGRQASGLCVRLWPENANRSLQADRRPDIFDSDLTGLVMDLSAWGVTDPAMVPFIDPPPVATWKSAVTTLKAIDVLNDSGALTKKGHQIAVTGLPPLLANLFLIGVEMRMAENAALLCDLIMEPRLGGRSQDIALRLERLQTANDKQSQLAKGRAERLAKRFQSGPDAAAANDIGILLARSFPGRVARAGGEAGRFVMANGRAALMHDDNPLASEKMIVVIDAVGAARAANIQFAVALQEIEFERAFADVIERTIEIEFSDNLRPMPKTIRRYGALILSTNAGGTCEISDLEKAYVEFLENKGIAGLKLGENFEKWRARINFANAEGFEGLPDLSDDSLLATSKEWLLPLIDPKAGLSTLTDRMTIAAISSLCDWQNMQNFDKAVPQTWRTPTGRDVQIDYRDEAGPTIHIRVQEVYGLENHPTILNGSVKLLFDLLSPAQRCLQRTTDLPGFWSTSWAEIRKEMIARYPKHAWPAEPWTAAPTTRVNRER